MNISKEDFEVLKLTLISMYRALENSEEYIVQYQCNNLIQRLQNIEAKDIKRRQSLK